MKLDGRSPVCKPLYTYEEVVAWEPGSDDLCVSKTTRSPRQPIRKAKTLVCHDMRGGYLEDRLVQGCPKSDCYRFYHWQYVDTFVYFSHHFITIPPATWIVPAHRHGVKVLGTLITEWDDGKRHCEAFLKSEESYRSFADKLVAISDYYGFDGWLVNIENAIEEGDQVKKLQGFLGYLTELQHIHDPGSEVIWYDSVIDTGKLAWQDELNEKNRMFFDVCDGIFLNYCWKDENLKTSKTQAVDAGRPYDVYVGIDVFGRGCLGDGGFNTCEALSAVNKHDLSVALFANGWVYEKLGKENFVQNENKFWRCLQEFCFPRKITRLPLVTTFCQGQGHHYWLEGKAIHGPWYNQSVQQLQPSYTDAQFDKEEYAPLMPVMEHHMEEAFSGGNCLKLEGKLIKGQNLNFRLFSLDVDMKPYSQEVPEGTPGLYVIYSYKHLQNEAGGLCLKLELWGQSSSSGAKPSQTVIILPGSPTDAFHVTPPQTEENVDVRVIFDKKTEMPSQVGAADGMGWKTSSFEIPVEMLKNARLSVVTAVLTSHSKDALLTTVLLGEIKLIPVGTIPDVLPSLMFGETIYQDSIPVSRYINAENNELDRGIAKDGDKNKERKDEGHDETDAPKTEIGDTVTSKDSEPVATDSSVSKCVDTKIEAKASDTDVTTETDAHKVTEKDTENRSAKDELQETIAPIIEANKKAKSDSASEKDVETARIKETDSGNTPADDKVTATDSILSESQKSNIIKCRESFTLQWRVSNPDKVQYYRVFQVQEPFNDLKMLGLTILPCFKVTGFEIQSTKGDDSETEINAHGDNSAIIDTQSEAKFECIVQPVLTSGDEIPLNVCKRNKKSEIFRLESKCDFS